MRYLLVLVLLSGCAMTSERAQKLSSAELCGFSDMFMTNETYRVIAVELDRRNTVCAPPAGFAYPPPQQTIVVNPN